MWGQGSKDISNYDRLTDIIIKIATNISYSYVVVTSYNIHTYIEYIVLLAYTIKYTWLYM